VNWTCGRAGVHHGDVPYGLRTSEEGHYYDLMPERPPLDPEFLPAALWNRDFQAAVRASGNARRLAIALERQDGSCSVFHTAIFADARPASEFYVERLVKFLLWQRGGWKLTIAGDPAAAAYMQRVYSETGPRAFDFDFMGRRVYGRPMAIEGVTYERAPEPKEIGLALGRHQDGCRIGFDLGGSDRKCAAVMDGEVVHSEEVVWDPYFQADPGYHFAGINDSLQRAAARLPRVDAIGGSAAGIYVDNEVRVASLFRGVPPDLFDQRVRRIFFDLQRAWNGVPFVVANDGEVTALAASMALGDTAVLGISMGTSQAAGYVNPQGNITDWLNELAFAPVDYRKNAPLDEWSGDGGAGAQYFSQQAVNRLLPAAGIALDPALPLAEKLAAVQELMAAGDERARRIFESIGVYLGYAIAQYDAFYELRHVLVLGRVMTGDGGGVILSAARRVLQREFPEVEQRLRLHLPGEREKRLGQAVAAATLPRIGEI
jgi:predicted NBD/HSP70 family sugar kinase